MFLSVKIAYESYGYSNHVGTYDEGQFVLMGGVRLPAPGTGPWDLRVGGDDPSAADQIAVVLHMFDWEGRHRDTAVRWVGPQSDRESYEEAAAATKEMLAGLGTYHYCDVDIRPFKVSVEGIKFALRRTLSVMPPFFEYEFSPYHMFFAWPFDGTYDT